ncbi:TPA: FecR domain-containing protein [Providencia stuartii]|uniref:Sigma factor regulatory protein, FecR/PupR family n=1 Tax=Providencia stuartii ATCC 25827 TaxID=471874 RepID=A0AA86YE81_PROST|nr:MULTISPECIES: FecR domain-containing protein [Providencia]EDU57310.1 sigma factor regulatory protein, FecR/PupR family [Providencia stuartii ATCC 25827]QPN41140.1 FecR domain-containing protein [Providencia sp. 2.29]SST03591.1 transmembrane sensor [Acinetobacter baumannii]AIN62340.1 fecR family protein [Providencia stuartii]AVE41096.1 transmembrane sensor [Providencia stuartii]
MTRTTHSEPDTLDSIDEQAALWFTRKHSQQMSAEQAKQFDIWLHASPEHAKAYEAIAGVWREFDSMPRPASIELPPKKQLFFRLWRPLGNTLAALFIAAILFLPYSQLPSMLFNNMTLVATNMPKEVTLSDGSALFLNRQTRVRVAYETEVRRIYLDEGNAYFKVKSNPYRPFVILADERRIQVIGTEFEVDRHQQQVAVRVSKGIVSLKTGQEQATTYLFAGDSATSSAINSPVKMNKIAPLDVARWRFGELSFTDKPLAEVLSELNAYSPVNIELSPPSLAQSKISGRINLRQPESFFQALPMLLPVQVVYQDKNNILIIQNKKNK